MFKNKTKTPPQSQKNQSILLILKKSMIIILDFFLIYLFIASLGNAFFPKYSAKYLGIAAFPVASGSMEPFLHGPKNEYSGQIGDLVFIRGVWDASKLMPVGAFDGKQITKNPTTKPYKVGTTHPKNGDVVIFENPNYNNPNVSEQERQAAQKHRFIIHRVVYNDSKNELIGTWGDANDTQHKYEQKIPYHKIVGKYVCKDRYIFPSIKNFFSDLFAYIVSFFAFLFENPLYLFLIIVYLMIMAYLLYSLIKELKAAK
ncbi:S26 family signal peptidase [Rice orange leaf phytoplasma]|uniref:S26 family signal peptidase n=1 Tax=Rice orange leaf phytoplasma TaxID=146897 RepID=UPI0008F5E2BD|nr:S26 family signal peptidase [Rice orange leaf phytoplasma]OIJ44772.1 S26 family signal peptidase [Rice orange leaf phytoplasma]